MNMLQFGLHSSVAAVSGATIRTALLNTVIGMGTVFIILIFISFLISLFGYIPKLQEMFKKKEEPVVASVPVVPETAEEEPEEEEELTDDTELVAVITAAIMASMGDEVPADGLVVRSIRRVGKKGRTLSM